MVMAGRDEAPHILVIDDDRRIRELIKTYLQANAFRVSAVQSAREARESMRGLAFDLLVVDVMMPGESGLSLTQSLRAMNNNVPILILSALAEAGDRINGLMSGSDDYLGKPFEPRELLLRIHNLLRRSGGRSTAVEVCFGPFVFNRQKGELRRDGETIKLTTREREMLKLLVDRAGQTVQRLDLAQPGAEEGARSVDVQINRLRQKIETDPANPVHLQTVRGVGYMLHLDEERGDDGNSHKH
jgi:two-component system phosphate regulon response regulator OmpR